MIMKERLRRNIVSTFTILLAVLVCLIVHFLIFYPERKKIEDYRKELVENRKSVKAYVYLKNPKKRRFEYRFKIQGIEYEGGSRYIQMCPHPEKGDSIWVYYKEDDPKVNLWVGEFEY